MATVTNGTRATAPPAPTVAPSRQATLAYESGSGWIAFAGIMFVTSAFLNFIWGLAAVSNSHFFVGNASYIFSGLNTWGWIAICFAGLELLAALSIFRGGSFGRWFGITVAAFALVAAMMAIPAYPLWSLVLAAIDGVIIYGLAIYGGKPELVE